MTEAGLKTLIETTLTIPVFKGQDSIIYPAATLEVTEIAPRLFGDGHSVVRESTAQIDLWYISKADRDDAVENMITAMDATGDITSPTIDTYYDTTAKKYRATIVTTYRYGLDES